MYLTPNFSLYELVASSKARQLGINNAAPPEIVPRLVRTAEMLERIRTTLGVPVTVTSGYRCHALNRAVGGVTSSDHTQGRAADIVAPGYGTPYRVAKGLAPLIDTLGIGQLILEGIGGKSWVHVSTVLPERAVNRVITITGAGAQMGIQEVA